MNSVLSFTGKTVVVVGGTSGINLGIAKAFAAAGASLMVLSRKQEKVDAAVEMLLRSGAAKAIGFAADVRDPDAMVQAMAETADQLGSFDVVVSGAAGNFPALAMGMSANAFSTIVDIDLLGTFHVMQAVYPHLKRPGASIINISAPQSQIPMVAQAHVSAAKAGVDMLTKSLCVEWGVEGIRVNSVIPGPIQDTEGMARLAPTEQMQAMVQASVPLKRYGTAQDIANACLFLGSEYASYISGAVIPVDGGWLQGGVAVVGAKLGDAIQRKSKQ